MSNIHINVLFAEKVPKLFKTEKLAINYIRLITVFIPLRQFLS